MSNQPRMNNAGQRINNPGQAIKSTIQSPLQQVAQVFGNQNSQDLGQASQDFLQSNSLVAKFGFLVLVIIGFIILIRMGTALLSKFILPPPSPHIIDGMIDATKQVIIPMAPGTPGSKPIARSDNQGKGLEFTWNVWLYIKNLAPDKRFKHIFHKGNDNITTTEKDNCETPETLCPTDGTELAPNFDLARGTCGLNNPNNAPGLYLDPCTNKLWVIMNTYSEIIEHIEIDNVPLNMWVNVIIRVQQRVVDIYINGAIAKRHTLNDIPKQNYGDVYMSMNGGYNGLTSNLWYFDHALGPGEILNIVRDGPNTKMLGNEENKVYSAFPPYFSLRWYFKNEQSV